MYRFDKNWLLSKYREPSDVTKHVKDERDRMVLMGVHKRDYHKMGSWQRIPPCWTETLNRALVRYTLKMSFVYQIIIVIAILLVYYIIMNSYNSPSVTAIHDAPTVTTASSPTERSIWCTAKRLSNCDITKFLIS